MNINACTRYGNEDLVYMVIERSIPYKDEKCPYCNDTGKLQLTNGKELICHNCPPTKYKLKCQPHECMITSVRVETFKDGSIDISYRINGIGTVGEDKLFDTYEEAKKESDEINAKANSEKDVGALPF